MPNQRAKNKIYLGGFLEKGLHQQIVRLAKQAGMEHNKFGFATLLMWESVQRRQRKKPRVAKKQVQPSVRKRVSAKNSK